MKPAFKFPLFLSLIVIMGLFLSACSDNVENHKKSKSSNQDNHHQTKLADKQVLHLSASRDISTMDVHHAVDVLSKRILQEAKSGLMRQGKNGKIVPDIAAGMPKVNDDKTVYTFKIRKDAKWSNGDPVTAQDFVYSWKGEVSKKTASESTYFFTAAGIKNAEKILDSDSKMYNQVNKLGVKALDKHTLQVNLDRPVPFFLVLTTAPAFFPINQDVVEKYGENYATDPDKMVYNGPFVLSKWNHGDGWVFEKNPKYWNKDKIHLNRVKYKVVKTKATETKLYQTGKMDYIELSPEAISQFEGQSDMHKGVLSPTMHFLRLNTKVPGLKNENIRNAIYNAMNREKLVKYLLKDGSSPAYYIVGKDLSKTPEGKDFRAAYPEINKHSLKWAKEKWQKGLKEIGKHDIHLEMQAYEGANEQVSEYLKAQLEKNLPGMHIKIHQETVKQYLKALNEGKYDISVAGREADYPDPMSNLTIWTTGADWNFTGYANPKYDQLIKKAKYLGAHPAQRMKVMQKAENMMLNDAPIVPLYQSAVAYLRKPYVKQSMINKPGSTLDWTYIYIAKHK